MAATPTIAPKIAPMTSRPRTKPPNEMAMADSSSVRSRYVLDGRKRRSQPSSDTWPTARPIEMKTAVMRPMTMVTPLQDDRLERLGQLRRVLREERLEGRRRPIRRSAS